MKSNIEHDLDERVLQWVLNTVDPDATVESIQKLKGSTSSTLHRISLMSNEDVINLVVRQFDNQDWLKEEPDVALQEAESLRLAGKVNVQTPEIIAFDETSNKCGLPVILMTMLDGSVELKPTNKSQWVSGFASALVEIHKVDADDFKWEYYTYKDLSSLEIPSWSSVPKSWEKAIGIVQGPQPRFKASFIHRDYHPANILWKDNAVSGVVDWPSACRGPIGTDVGHCRLNLAMLYDVATADAFLNAYEQKAGDIFTYDRYWDLLSLIDILFGPPTVYPGWEAFGVTGLTDKMMEERLDTYVQSLVGDL